MWFQDIARGVTIDKQDVALVQVHHNYDFPQANGKESAIIHNEVNKHYENVSKRHKELCCLTVGL